MRGGRERRRRRKGGLCDSGGDRVCQKVCDRVLRESICTRDGI